MDVRNGMFRSGSECPEIVRKVITEVSELTGNSTVRSSGTVVALECLGPYELIGSPLLVCVDGQWNLPVPACVIIDSYHPEDVLLSSWSLHIEEETMIITLGVLCACVIFLLTGLFLTCYHFRRDRKLQKEEDARAQQSTVSTITTPDRFRSDHFGLPGSGWDYFRPMYPYTKTYTPYPDYWHRDDETIKTEPILVSDKRAKRKKRTTSVRILETPVEPDEVKWDLSTMDWHSTYDYDSNAKLPRPQLLDTPGTWIGYTRV